MTNANLIGINGHEVALDKDGYLLNLADWDERVATFLASQEEITLGPAHWEVINCLRNFYNRHQMSPPNRALANPVKRDLVVAKASSMYSMKLFRRTTATNDSKHPS